MKEKHRLSSRSFIELGWLYFVLSVFLKTDSRVRWRPTTRHSNVKLLQWKIKCLFNFFMRRLLFMYSIFSFLFSFRRGHSTSASSDKSQSAVAPVRATHVTSQSHDVRDVSGAEEFLKTQDDSVVYSETPTKKQGSKLKSQRRVESFKWVTYLWRHFFKIPKRICGDVTLSYSTTSVTQHII